LEKRTGTAVRAASATYGAPTTWPLSVEADAGDAATARRRALPTTARAIRDK
jgi:hypothetical protein